MKTFLTTATSTMWKDKDIKKFDEEGFSVAAAACYFGGLNIDFRTEFAKVNVTIDFGDGGWKSRT